METEPAKSKPPLNTDFVEKRAIATYYITPSPASVVVCLDQKGPLSARSYPGRQLDRACSRLPGQPTERAKQEVGYCRRSKGCFFGVFLHRTDAWLPTEAEDITRDSAILDNLNIHRATDVLLFSLVRPRWQFVFHPQVCRLSQANRIVVKRITLLGAQRATLPCRGRGDKSC